MKQFPVARTQDGKEMFEVGGGTRGGAKRGRIERASPRGEEQDASDAASYIEATRAEVLVRQAVAREVEDRPQQERRKSRPARRAGGGARSHVERDDHGCPSQQIARTALADRAVPIPTSMIRHNTTSLALSLMRALRVSTTAAIVMAVGPGRGRRRRAR